MLNTFFPNNSYRIILERKKNIKSIKEYQRKNNGQFPVTYVDSCSNRILSLFSKKINPNQYNYDCTLFPLFRYSDFVKVFIRKYKSGFVSYHFNFRMKHLNNNTEIYIINEIDQMYTIFHTYITSEKGLLTSQSSSSSFFSRSSSKLKRTDSYERPVCSILRDSSTFRHSKKTVVACNSRTFILKPTISDAIGIMNKDKNISNDKSEE